MKVRQDGVPVEELIEEVQGALRTANVGTQGSFDLRVRSARLVLSAVASGGAGAKVDFRIPVIGMKLSMGAKVERRDTHTIDVTLVPPSDEHELRTGQVAQILVNSIETTRKIMRKAGAGQDRLVLNTSTVEISFVITEEGTISLGFDGELRDEITHTITLELGPPDSVPST